MAGVGNFVLGNLPDLMRQQRDDGERFAGESHEFDGAALAALVNEHDRADVVLGQAMLRQVGRQHHAVEFFEHVIGQFHSLRLRAFALKNLFPYLRAFPVRAQAFQFRKLLHGR